MSRIKFCTFFITLVLGFAVGVHGARAATMTFSVNRNYSIGQVFSVPVLVSTNAGETLNAVSATVGFPTDKLQLVSLSKNGSFISLWSQEPSFSNAAGTAAFEGIVFNPGWAGQAGQVILLTFKVRAAGSAVLYFNSASILANDGNGTNILDSAVSRTITLTEGTLDTTPVQPEVKKPIVSPKITSYTRELNEGDVFSVRGTSYPGSTVTVQIQDGVTTSVLATNAGEFTYTSSESLSLGAHSFTLIAEKDGVTSDVSGPYAFTILKSATKEPLVLAGYFLVNYLSLILVVLVVIAFLAAVAIYCVHVLVGWKKRLRKSLSGVEKTMYRDFSALTEDIEAIFETLKEAQKRRALTKEELHITETLKRHIMAVEKDITSEVEKVKRKLK